MGSLSVALSVLELRDLLASATTAKSTAHHVWLICLCGFACSCLQRASSFMKLELWVVVGRLMPMWGPELQSSERATELHL